jgi:hypothetical protein
MQLDGAVEHLDAIPLAGVEITLHELDDAQPEPVAAGP